MFYIDVATDNAIEGVLRENWLPDVRIGESFDGLLVYNAGPGDVTPVQHGLLDAAVKLSPARRWRFLMNAKNQPVGYVADTGLGKLWIRALSDTGKAIPWLEKMGLTAVAFGANGESFLAVKIVNRPLLAYVGSKSSAAYWHPGEHPCPPDPSPRDRLDPSNIVALPISQGEAA